MPGKRTLEELRAAGAARQKRWREKHLGFAKLKEKNAWAARKATAHGITLPLTEGPLLPNIGPKLPNATQETYYEDMALVEGEAGVVRGHAWVEGRRRGVGIPEGLKELERGGGRGGIFKGVGKKDEFGVIGADAEGSVVKETANELATYAKLEQLKERKARGGLNGGVEVELEV